MSREQWIIQTKTGVSYADTCVITAAGASSRMGTWKPILPFGESTILETTVDTAIRAGLRVVLVIGFRGDELSRRFANKSGVQCVRNLDWESGLLSSVIVGAISAESDFLFIMNGDKPLVRPATYRKIFEAAKHLPESGRKTTPIYAGYKKEPGHPVFAAREIVIAATSKKPASSMRSHLDSFGPMCVECDDPGVIIDIDTPEEYRKYTIDSST